MRSRLLSTTGSIPRRLPAEKSLLPPEVIRSWWSILNRAVKKSSRCSLKVLKHRGSRFPPPSRSLGSHHRQMIRNQLQRQHRNWCSRGGSCSLLLAVHPATSMATETSASSQHCRLRRSPPQLQARAASAKRCPGTCRNSDFQNSSAATLQQRLLRPAEMLNPETN